jgi:Sec-independent protein translocase protein TatA
MLGTGEIILIVLVILIIWSKQLPKMAKQFGKQLKILRKA